MDRRTCLKLIGTVGVASLGGAARAEAATTEPSDTYGILVDLTTCVGCRTCEKSCAAANELCDPEEESESSEAVEAPLPLAQRETTPYRWTVVNSHQTSKGEVFAKRQCMHCVTPACATACLTKAMTKTKEGPVVWRANKCMGCRYCMISCPFDVPRFEYNSPVPKIQKCRMCWEKLVEGESPACVETCIMEALKFGKRSELLQIARERVYQNPEKYISHIYGEHELGGTGVLYISAVPFEELGFPTNLDDVPVAENTRDFMTAVPVILTLFPALLFGLRQATQRTDDATDNPVTEV